MGNLSLSVLIKCVLIKRKRTEKQYTINYIIIFNDSISKFYQCSIRGFCQGISMFFSICLGKKMPRIKFLGILKYMSPRIKCFWSTRKAMFRTFQIFSNLISQHRSFAVLSTDVCMLFSFFVFLFSYISF